MVARKGAKDAKECIALNLREPLKTHNEPAKETSSELENEKRTEGVDESLRFKGITDLTDAELSGLIGYYENLDLSSSYKKNRKDTLRSLTP